MRVTVSLQCTVQSYQDCSATLSTTQPKILYIAFICKIMYLSRKYPELRIIHPHFELTVLIFYRMWSTRGSTLSNRVYFAV